MDDRLFQSGTSSDYDIKSNIDHLLRPVLGQLRLAATGYPFDYESIIYSIERIQLALDLINETEEL